MERMPGFVWWTAIATGLWTLALVASFRPFMPDEAQHVDYGWSVWHRQLPVFDTGIVAPLPVGEFGPQWTSHHPPAYAALISPLVGPLLDAGHAHLALLLSRCIGAVLAGASVLAVARLALLTFRGSPYVPHNAALLFAASPSLAVWAALVVNDLLALLAALVAFVGVAMFVRGRSFAAAVPPLACTLALATRAHGLVVVVLCAAVLALSAWIERSRRGLLALTALATLVIPIVATAAFWWRNIELTGSIVGYRPDFYESLGRVVRPLSMVATDSEVWSFVAPRLVPTGFPLLALLVAGVLWWTVGELRHRGASADAMLLALLPVGLAAATVGLFIAYLAAGGTVNPRYLLPVLPAVAVVSSPMIPPLKCMPLGLPLLVVLLGWTPTLLQILVGAEQFRPLNVWLTTGLAFAALGCLAIAALRVTAPELRNVARSL
jgi:hypothetical protein